MRAALYARYSSDLQRAASIEDQIRLCRERISREGWQLVATYTDRASSGADRLRPGYQKLMEDARAGNFDVVMAVPYVVDLDREASSSSYDDSRDEPDRDVS